MTEQNALKVTEAEYKKAYDLSSDANVPEQEAAEYWQVVRYYRGQIFNRSEAESALSRLRNTAEQNAIQIHLGPQGWLATFTGPHSAEIGELFDTCTLPLPYTSQMPLGTVIAEVQKRNPAVVVKHWSAA